MHGIMWKSDCPSQHKYILFYSLTKAQQEHTVMVLGTNQNWIKSDFYQEYRIIFQPKIKRKRIIYMNLIF